MLLRFADERSRGVVPFLFGLIYGDADKMSTAQVGQLLCVSHFIIIIIINRLIIIIIAFQFVINGGLTIETVLCMGPP